MKQAIMVLGMHRSGTSAMTGALSRLGARPPRTEIGASTCNPKGHFESELIARMNDRLLQACGSLWYDWRSLDAAALSPKDLASFRDEAAAVIACEFEGADPIVVKDPRICRLVPAWRDFLDMAGYAPKFILPVRSSAAVAQSLVTRSELSPETGRLLWLRHVLEAERATRGLDRHIVLADDFLRDPDENLRAALGGLGLDALAAAVETAALRQFVDPGLFHLPESLADMADNPLVAGLADRVYAVFTRRGPDFEGELDRLAAEFDGLTELFDAPTGDLIAAIHEAEIAKTAVAKTWEKAKHYRELASKRHQTILNWRTKYEKIVAELRVLKASNR